MPIEIRRDEAGNTIPNIPEPSAAAHHEDPHDESLICRAIEVGGESITICERAAHIAGKHMPAWAGPVGSVAEVVHEVIKHPSQYLTEQVVCGGISGLVGAGLNATVTKSIQGLASEVVTPLGGLVVAVAAQPVVQVMVKPLVQSTRASCGVVYNAIPAVERARESQQWHSQVDLMVRRDRERTTKPYVPSTKHPTQTAHQQGNTALSIIPEGHKLLSSNPDQAIRSYNEALQKEPGNRQAYLEIGKGLFMLGRYAAAMLATTRACGSGLTPAYITGEAADPSEISKLYAASQKHLASYGDTLRKGTLNTPIDNDSSGIQQMHSNTGLSITPKENVLSYVSQRATSHPTQTAHQQSNTALSIIQEGHKLCSSNPDQAIRRYNEALQKEPGNRQTYLEIGKGLFMLGRYAGAMLAATRACGSGLTPAYITGEAADPSEINKLYAASQNHFASYGETLRKGTLNTPIDNDSSGIQHMRNNTPLNQDRIQEITAVFSNQSAFFSDSSRESRDRKGYDRGNRESYEARCAAAGGQMLSCSDGSRYCGAGVSFK